MKQFADKVSTITDPVSKLRSCEKYTTIIENHILKRIPVLTYQRNSPFRSDKLNYLICTPIDKATNNVGFVCSKFYIEMICKELDITDFSSWPTTGFYIDKGENIQGILDRQRHIVQKYNLGDIDNNTGIPLFYGIPKFHKNPIKFRFIAGASNAMTTPLSIVLHNILHRLRSHLANYCKIAEQRSGDKLYISVKSNLDVLNKLHDTSTFHSATTYDFSTLYTKLPHNVIIQELFSITQILFKNSNCKYLVTRREKNKYGKSAYYSNHYVDNDSWLSFTEQMVYELIHTVVTESYVTFAGKPMYQRAVFRMGGNASPLIADLVLSSLELKFFKTHSFPKNADIYRYIDDILAVNINIEPLINNAYPPCMQITTDRGTADRINYLDFSIDFNKNCTVLFNKTDIFPFKVIRSFHGDSCVPDYVIVGVIVGNLVRFSRIHTHLDDFLAASITYCKQLLLSRHNKTRILGGIKKFVSAHKQKLGKFKLHNSKIIRQKFIRCIHQELQ